MDARSRSGWKFLLVTAVVGVVTFALGRFKTDYPVIPTDVALRVVPAGVCLLAGLLFGWRAVLGVVLGVAAVAGTTKLPTADAAVAVWIAAAQAAAAAAVRRFIPAAGGSRTSDILSLFALFTGLSVVRGLVTAGGWWVVGNPDPLTTGLVCGGQEWATVVIIGPAVFVWQRFPPVRTAARWAEFGGVLFLTGGSCQVVFGGSAPASLNLHPQLLIWFLGLFAWASFRFYLHGSSAVAVVLYAVIYANAVGRGGFDGLMPANLSAIHQTELLVVLSLLTALQHFLAAVSADRHGGAGEVARLHDELKAQHAALEQQERDGAARRAFLEAVLAQLPAGVMIAGPDGRILVRNDRHRRMFITEPDRLSELPQGRMSTTQTHRLPFDRWPIVRALRDGQVTEGFSVRMQLDDGQSIDANVCAAPVRGPAGELLGAVSVMTDVTERNKVVRELRANEQKLRVALQAAHMIVMEWQAADGRLVRPEALADWLGLPPGPPLRTVADVLPHVHPDHADQLAEKVGGLMAGVPRCETVFRLKDGDPGRPVWVLSRSLALVDDGGHPTGVVTSVLVDVTERYRHIDQLRLLESAVVHARDAVIILENKSQAGGGRSVLYANAAFAQMSGYAADEVIGRSLHFLRGPNSDQRTLDRLRDALDAREPFQCELLNYRKDGSEYWVELSVVPVPDPTGACSHWVMIQRDVSDRKRAETELRQSREGLAEAQRIAHLGSWEYDVRTGASRWSDEMFRIYGYPVGGIAPTVDGYLAAVHPDDRERVARRVADDMRHQTPTPRQLELRIVRPDGESRHITEQYYVECDADGRAVAVRGVTQDVTDRRQAQEQLVQAQKMELIGQMAGGIAHDFNNLLTGVIGNLDLVALPPDDPNRRLIDTAVKAAYRATDMTRKLLGFARKSQLRTAPLALGPVVAEVTEFVGRTTDPRIRVQSAVRTAGRVEGDPTLLSQVLLNLCLNARDAMPNGGTLELRADDVAFPPHAPHPSGRTGEFVRLSVEDTGTGMTADVRAHIFEPFFTTKPVGEGTGLGLPMVAGIVEQHRGWVECDTAVGRGTRFDLYLPRHSDPAPDLTLTPAPVFRPLADTPTDTPFPPARPPRTVLLVDDEVMIRDLARTVLETNGFRVLEACDGEQAIDVFRTAAETIDLVLLDLTMPRMSGQDTFRALVDLDPSARVLFSSGYSADSLAGTDGSLGLLPKPYRPTELLAAVSAAVNGQPVAAG